MNSIVLQSLKQRSNIESNKAFQRLAEKTQVLLPRCGMKEISKNRYSHSHEVATSSLMIAAKIAEQFNVSLSIIDYQESLFNTGLLHDIGHPSFGHDGAKLLSNYFKNLGLEEGFSDNNNNLVVIDKNNIYVSDYVISSTIKYPEKLYSNQKEKYLPLLNEAIDLDIKHYSSLGINLSKQSTTIACQIMDEADRNSYICSDLTDFLCLGNSLSLEDLKNHARQYKMNQFDELSALAHTIKGGSKNAIKSYFNTLKNRFNENYKLTSDGLTIINQELHHYREFLGSVEYEFFILPIKKSDNCKNNMNKLKCYIDAVVKNGFMPSRHYKTQIEKSICEKEKLVLMRDMIGEVTDWFILNYYKTEHLNEISPNSSSLSLLKKTSIC
jgi:dGTP triphosphohydrolase